MIDYKDYKVKKQPGKRYMVAVIFLLILGSSDIFEQIPF